MMHISTNTQWILETWANTSPPGLSCLVSHLNHSISEPVLIWEYSVSRSVHASFEVILPAILITNSNSMDLPRITLASLSIYLHPVVVPPGVGFLHQIPLITFHSTWIQSSFESAKGNTPFHLWAMMRGSCAFSVAQRVEYHLFKPDLL